jgi:hypothetical protein
MTTRFSVVLLACVAFEGADAQRLQPVAARYSQTQTVGGLAPYTTLAPLPDGDAGWANGAAILGFVTAGISLIGGVMSEDGISGETGLIIGAMTTAQFAISLPLVYAGGRSARTGTAVGLPSWRFTGWLGYGLTLVDAALLLGLGAADIAVPGGPSSVGVLGALSSVAMALDASESARQARKR